MYNRDYITKEAKEAGKHLAKTKELTVSKTITHTTTFWSMIEQIRSKRGLNNVQEALWYCAYYTARELGIESWQFVMLVVRVSMQNMKRDQPVVKIAVMLEQFTYANMFTMLKERNLENFVIVKVSKQKKRHEPSRIITI